MNTTSHTGKKSDRGEYPPPVARIASMGGIHLGTHWFDYRTLGITNEHVDALCELATDGGYDRGRQHAWRALGQLRRRLERIADQIAANGKNPQCWHMAKSFIMQGMGRDSTCPPTTVLGSTPRCATSSVLRLSCPGRS